MTRGGEAKGPDAMGFRTRVFLAIMLVVSAVAVGTLVFTQRNLAARVRSDYEREFTGELAARHRLQEFRDEALAERCLILASKPRIHAALEDGALDLLYPSARDELRGVIDLDDGSPARSGSLRAAFYRFLDPRGRVIPPQGSAGTGSLAPGEEAQLNLARLPDSPQTGYLVRDQGPGNRALFEVIAMPIVSTENGDTISALVLGFRSPESGGPPAGFGIVEGIWTGGNLVLPALPASLAGGVSGALRAPLLAREDHGGLELRVAGLPYLLFFKRLNAGSLFPAAYEVSVFPLAEALSGQRQLIWEVAGAGALLLMAALLASQFISRRLSEPVERLVVDSRENREHRQRAEAALETTSRELQRSARFSADASHQLKTPVTVLRAGLEELLAGDSLGPEAREEVSRLVHQTFRLAGVIEDLLLLSRMDSGKLQLQFTGVDLSILLGRLVDDLSALPDAAALSVEADIPPSLSVAGERRYTELILENLLENARKYNLPGGRIRVEARAEGPCAVVAVGNTGPGIPAQSHESIFERFHRGAVGENVPGHGIGLNLARELARIHGGELKLVRSDKEWTKFELRLRLEPLQSP